MGEKKGVKKQKNKIKKEESKTINVKEKIKGFITKRNIIIAISVIVLFIIGYIIIRCLFFNEFSDYSIAYVEDEQLILYNNASDTKIIVEEEFDTDDNSNLIAAYPHNRNDYFAYVDNGTLYLYKVNEKNKVKISSSMENGSVYFSPNDHYIIYQDEDNNIYSYNIKKSEKNKIISGNSEIYFNIVGNYMFINDNEDKTVYVKDLNSDKDKEKITSDEFDSSRITLDGTRVLYTLLDDEESGTYSVYVYDVKKGEKTKVLANVLSFETNDDFSEFIYLVKSKQEINLLDDDELGQDPVTTTTRVCTYSDYYNDLCTYDEWLYEEEIQVSVSKKETNDQIRDYAKDAMILYDIYYQKGSENSKLLVEGVTSIIKTNITNKMIIYKKIPSNVEKVKISTLKNLDDFKEYESTIKEVVYYSINGAKETELVNNDLDINDAYILDNNDIYVISEYDGYDSELYYYNNKNNKLILLDDSFYYMYKQEDNYLIYTSDYDNGKQTFKRAKGDETIEIITDIYSTYVYNETILLSGDCEDAYSCTLYKLDGIKTKKIAEDIYYAVYLNDNNMYLLKNYSSSRGTVDIYSYRNGKIENIAFDVEINYLSIPILPSFYQ